MKDELTFEWCGELAYPTLYFTEVSANLQFHAYESVTDDVQSFRLLKEIRLPTSIKLSKPGLVVDVRVYKFAVGLIVKAGMDENFKKLIIISKTSLELAGCLNLNLVTGYDKFVLTKGFIFVGSMLPSETNPRHGFTYEIFQAKIDSNIDQELKSVYKGEGLDFDVDPDNDNLIAIHKNFDELSLLEIGT